MAKKKLILNESVTRRFMKLATIKPAYVSNFINEAEEEMAMEEEEEDAPEDMEMDAEAPEGAEEPMEDPGLEVEDEMEDPVEDEGAQGAEALVMLLQTQVFQMSASLHWPLWILAPLLGVLLIGFTGWWSNRQVIVATPLQTLRKL